MTMRAWRVHELGEPEDVLRLDDVPDPTPEPREVVIDVAAAAMNFPDILVCKGMYQEKPPLPFTPGIEVAGTITAVGEDVADIRPGQRVIAWPKAPYGALSEQTVATARRVFPIPDGMPFDPAVCLQVTYQTGWAGLHHRAHLQAGETLLVHAGAGGVGSAAIQLGVAAGARVIATAGGPDKVELCRKLGAEIAIDYRTEDFVEIVKDATDGEGADVVYDPVGGEIFERSTKCIAFEGRIIVIGFTSGSFGELRANHVLLKNYAVVGLHWGIYGKKRPDMPMQVHNELMKLWQDGKIEPLISRVVPMDEAPSAMASIGRRDTVGKLIVHPSD